MFQEKYCIRDKIASLIVCKCPLVTQAKKAFWLLNPPLPKYLATHEDVVHLHLYG